MTDRFTDACRIDETEPGVFSWDVPAGWLQGRGAWGGLVIAASVNAVEVAQQQSADRRMRSVTAHMFRTLPAGTARIDVTPLRVGSAMTTWKASVTGSDGTAAAHSVIITGTPRAGDIDEPWGTASMPDLPDWRAVPSLWVLRWVRSLAYTSVTDSPPAYPAREILLVPSDGYRPFPTRQTMSSNGQPESLWGWLMRGGRPVTWP